MSSVPWLDLNEQVRDPVLDDGLGIDLKQSVRHPVPVPDDNLKNPDDVKEDVFDLNNPVFWNVNKEDADQEQAPWGWEPDLDAAHACQKESPAFCEPDLNLNEVANNGQVVLLPDLNEIPGAVGALRTRRKHYSDDTKRAVYAMLLKGSEQGRLSGGLTLQVSLAMDVSLRCVQRIWNAGQKGGGVHAVASKKGNCGRKRIEVCPEAITAIPLKDRTTLENVARYLGMAKSTIFRRVKEGRIERHSVAIHPLLRNEDKRSRAHYYPDMLEPNCSSSFGFKSNYNVTHMDKKWLCRTKSTQKFYCAPGEEILK